MSTLHVVGAIAALVVGVVAIFVVIAIVKDKKEMRQLIASGIYTTCGVCGKGIAKQYRGLDTALPSWKMRTCQGNVRAECS